MTGNDSTPRGNRTLAFWEEIGGGIHEGEDDGSVRLTTDVEYEGCESWTGEPCEDCNRDNPPFMLAGQYRTLDGQWVTADSIGGMHLSWGRSWLAEIREDEGYIEDIMLSTLEAAHRYARRFVEHGMPVA